MLLDILKQLDSENLGNSTLIMERIDGGVGFDVIVETAGALVLIRISGSNAKHTGILISMPSRVWRTGNSFRKNVAQCTSTVILKGFI